MRIQRIETWPTAAAGIEALKTVRVGRLSASIQALPVIVPVPFAIDHDSIAITVPNEPGFLFSLDRAVVAFEGGTFDDGENQGWTVHVRGTANIIDSPDPGAEVSRLARITPQLIEGYAYRLLPR